MRLVMQTKYSDNRKANAMPSIDFAVASRPVDVVQAFTISQHESLYLKGSIGGRPFIFLCMTNACSELQTQTALWWRLPGPSHEQEQVWQWISAESQRKAHPHVWCCYMLPFRYLYLHYFLLRGSDFCCPDKILSKRSWGSCDGWKLWRETCGSRPYWYFAYCRDESKMLVYFLKTAWSAGVQMSIARHVICVLPLYAHLECHIDNSVVVNLPESPVAQLLRSSTIYTTRSCSTCTARL